MELRHSGFGFTLALAALVAGCGGGSPTGNSGNGGGGGGGGGEIEGTLVRMVNTSFSPQQVQIQAGGTITWRNDDPVVHNSTSDTQLWSSGNMSRNQTFSRNFPTAGQFPYNCTLHPGMVGTVVVN